DKSAAELKEESLFAAVSTKTQNLPEKQTGFPGDELIGRDVKECEVVVNNRKLKLSNLDKIYWPEDNISKRDMLNYYHEVAPYMLAYMKERPQSLNRHPNGIDGKSFYQKNVGGKVADWLTTYLYTSDSTGSRKDFLVCTDEASMLYIANLGCIEMNPWHSRIGSSGKPDWCVIDLDPDEIPFEKVVETALVVKQVLDSAGIESYCKTSGSTGLHIYIPFGARYSYDQSRIFAEVIANIVHHELPGFTSVERSPSRRRGKIYIDYLQNRSIQTIAAPYSLRPKPGATASAPLHWSEVRKGLRIDQFSIKNMGERIRKEGDLFAGVLGPGIDLEKVLEKLLEIG
ncbi:MAG: DNA ligase D, partial [Sphingobacteriales bacterium]